MGEKSNSWAPTLEKMKEPEIEDVQIKAMAASDKAEHMYKIELITQLGRIATALEDANMMYKLMNDIDVEVEDEKIKDDDPGEDAGPPTSRSKDGPKPVEVKMPENLKDDKAIAEYYTKKISELTNEKNAPLLDATTLGKVQVMVEEDKVRIKIPYMKDSNAFRTIASELRRMGGEYVSDGANTHYRMPKPAGEK
jgi:hypothetical protein